LDLRNYIGLTENVDIELILPEDIPNLLIDADQALAYARENRGDYLDYKIRTLNAQRQLAEAKAQRFDATLSASFGLNNNGTSLGDIYDDPNDQSVFTLRFDLPILDGGRNKARVGQARASQTLTEFQVEQDRISFEQSVLAAVRNFDQIKSAIEISKKRDQIAQKRFEISNNRYLIGKIDILQYTNALNDKDAAKQGYISSLRQYWTAYYEMRALTLYDFLMNERLFNPLLEWTPANGIANRAGQSK
jgi:outer membrane protein TolC